MRQYESEPFGRIEPVETKSKASSTRSAERSSCWDQTEQPAQMPSILFAVAAWRDPPYFTDAERAALTEVATRLSDRADPVAKIATAMQAVPMPELPDIAAYLNALEARIIGQSLRKVRLASPFLLRTVHPSIEEIEGHTVCSLRRIGKRIAIEFDNGIWMVLHLMIAGRLHWRPVGAKLGGRNNLVSFDFPHGSLVLTEAGAKHRASLHLFRNEEEMRSIDPGGVDVFAIDLEWFSCGTDEGESNPETSIDGSAHPERDRQYLFR